MMNPNAEENYYDLVQRIPAKRIHGVEGSMRHTKHVQNFPETDRSYYY